MIVQMFDRQDAANPVNGALPVAPSWLLHTLNALRRRKPFFCELVADNGYTLLLGVGPSGCAQCSRSDGRPGRLGRLCRPVWGVYGR